ncbi:DUF805 domain-containing protein [Coralloluteibacterium stylophorae]|uniref:DUF805 domain-containing protein n=1 Tax=Coralloluteibacterium stylophorae TaxID=1776034 RepID=A0A8J7VSK0_9GAMM|nr:DUF805 domain-containing protein [Coralloluteibacterium stylophorae]MBS7455550.1 DUF805 domain-containing protein [Coralloluteibacterium stylophorae]
MNWYVSVLKQYATFSGRARRTEYWMYTLINLLILFGLMVVDALIGTSGGIGVLSLIYSLAVMLPGIAVTVRRLHDTGRSGWWVLIALVPVAGIVLLVFMCLEGEAGSNDYGVDPKLAAA